MAKTFIGELILRLKDEMGDQSKKTARDVSTSMRDIETAAKRLNGASWGGRFQQQLDKLGLGANNIDQLRSSWDRLYRDINGKNLAKALQKSEMSSWKSAALGHFAQQQAAIREEMKRTEAHAKTWRNSMNNIFRTGLVGAGAYTGTYLAGVGLRGGVTASAEWQREDFRQQMANIPPNERYRIVAKAEDLSRKYPSVSITEIAELARNSRNMMGSTSGGLDILEEMVKGQVVLQSAQGVDIGGETMRSLLRGADNLGQNGGPKGAQNVRDIIAGLVRASQIEGRDFDPAKLLQFALRAKIAGPGLSTEFLANVAPAIIQDTSAPTAGTQMSSAFQAFVIGANSVSSKRNRAEQERIGIRNGDDLVGSDIMSSNPYEWANKVLGPALARDGVDMKDDGAIAKAVAKLSMNTGATSMLTKMLQQQEQIDRNIAQYRNALGTDAANGALRNDPFVSYKGFIESLNNLSAAVGEDVMPKIVSGLNMLSGGINTLQQAWRDGDPMAKAGIVGAGAAGTFGAWKTIAGVGGLITAGTNLNAAALSLQGAAAALGGSGVAGDLLPNGKKRAAWFLPSAGMSSLGAILAAVLLTSGSDENPEKVEQELDRLRARNRADAALDTDGVIAGQRDASSPSNPLQAAVDNATRVGGSMKEALSIEATPTVNTSSLDAALAKANELAAAIERINGMKMTSVPSVGGNSPMREINRTFSDIGVGP